MDDTSWRPTRDQRPTGWLPVAIAGTVVALITAACGGGGGGGDGSAGAEGTTSVAGEPASQPAGTDPTCEDGTLDDRRYILCTAGDQPDQGLVVALHGRGSSAEGMQGMTELEREAAEKGLAVVFPEGLDSGWGDDTFTTPDRPTGDEDVTFLDDLVDQLRSDRRIDDEPVGVVGFSNGASMALRYTVERPDEVRAVVAIAGQLPRDPSIRPSQPVSLLEVYGTADPIRGYDTGIPDNPGRQPGDPTPTLSTTETVAAFVDITGSPEHESPTETDPDPADGTRLRTESWTSPDATVVLHAIVDGGHRWPSAHDDPTGGEDFGLVSQDLDAGHEAIAFVLDPESVATS